MESKTKLSIFITLLFMAGAVGLLSYFLLNRAYPNTPQVKLNNLNTKSLTVGSVIVAVTPLITGASYEFDIELNTHSVELNYDLAAVAVLTNEKKQTLKPIKWEGDKPGGHHREGKLIFPKFNNRPKALNLTINEIGEEGVNFKWEL